MPSEAGAGVGWADLDLGALYSAELSSSPQHTNPSTTRRRVAALWLTEKSEDR